MKNNNNQTRAFLLILAVLTLALTLVFGAAGALAEEPPENTCGPDLSWSLSEEGVLTISGTGDMDDYALDNGVTTAPWGTAPSALVLGDDVSGIGDYAFAGCTLLSSASGQGLQRIGSNAFLDSSLETLVLPGTNTALAEDAVSADVVVTAGIWQYTVSGGEITVTTWTGSGNTAAVPETLNGLSVTGVADGVFANKNVNSLTLSSGEMILSSGAVDENVSVICGDWTYRVSAGKATLTGWKGSGGSLSLPESVNSIPVTAVGSSAFKNKAITAVTIPDGVLSIGNNAFEKNSITAVTLPGLETTVGSQGFDETVLVTSDKDAGEWSYHISGANITISVWRGNEENLVVPDEINGLHVTGFGYRVFYNRTFLKTVVLPDDTVQLGDELLRGCTALTHASMGNDSMDLPKQCFFACRALTGVDLPSALTTVGEYSFGNCTALADVTVPNGVTTIAASAFKGCSNMTALTLPATLEAVGDNAFENCNSLTAVDLPDSLTGLGSGVFTGCSALNNVRIGRGLTRIESSTFQGLLNLKTVTINSDNTYISQYAFRNCEALQTVVIQKATIAGGAFENCTGLRSFSMQGGRFESSAFSNCSLLHTVTLGSDVTEIPSYGFRSLPALKSVSILGVSSIPYAAFEGCGALANLTLGGDITQIGQRAFYNCASLTDFELPSGLSSIGVDAFQGCRGLTEINIPGGMTVIDTRAFQGCTGVTRISFGGSVTTIGEYAFSGCTGLTEVEIPDGVVTIRANAFSGCSALARATLPESVEFVGSGAFPSACRVYCDPTSVAAVSISANGGSFVSPDNDMFGIRLLLDGDISLGLSVEQIWADAAAIAIPEYIGGEMVTEVGKNALASCPEVTQVTLPASVPVIPEGLCKGNNSLISVIIPQGVTGIGKEAFANCSRLANVSIPESVAVIGEKAFDGCGLLAEVELSSHIQEIGADAFSSTKVYAPLGSDTAKMLSRTGGGFVCREHPLLRLKYLFVGGEAASLEVIGADSTAVSLDIPDGVTSVAAHAFENMSGLHTVTLSDSVTAIGEYAFAGSGITAVTLPAGVTEIPQYAFYHTASLREINVPGTVTQIGAYAFQGSGLTGVSFPDGLTTVGTYAFGDCSALLSASLPDSVTSMGSYAFYTCPNLNHFTVPAGVTVLEDRTFYNCTSLATVDLPYGLESIGDYAFYRSGLGSVSIPDTVKTIKQWAFYECKSLVTVTMAGSMDFIGNYAFANCTAMENLTLPDTLKTMEGQVFENNRKLREVILPGGLNTVAHYAFCGCESLNHVKVGEGTVLIDVHAFRDCRNLVSVELPDSLVRIGNSAFQNTGLTGITIPDHVTTIDSEAFNDCNSLSSISLPDSVVSIGTYAFNDCDSLQEVHLSAGLVSLPESTFRYCPRLSSVSLPEGLRAIGAYVFQENNALSAVLIPRSVTSIDDTAFHNINPAKLMVYCYHDTAADTFAQGKGYAIIYLDGEDLLEGLRLEPAQADYEINLGIGHSLDELDALFAVKPENAPYVPDILFSTEDEDVAVVANGVLTGVAAGDTRLVASFAENSDISASIVLHVRENITDFTLLAEIWQRRDETLTLLPVSTIPAGANTGYSWSIDRLLGEISGNVLTPSACGSGTLTAVSWNGIERSTPIHIYDNPSRIGFTNVPAGLDVGDSFTLQPQVKAGAVFTGDEARHFIAYSSADESIATVNAQGLVTAVGYGSTTITAAAENGVVGTANIHVSAHITDFQLQGRILAPVGAVIDLAATEIEPANANPNAFTWTSNPAGLVEYANGQVTVLTDKECEVTITATTWDGALSKETKLTIYRPAVEEVKIQPVNQWNWVEPYKNIQLTALVTATELFENQLVTWSVSGDYLSNRGVSISQTGVLYTGGWTGWDITVTATADNSESDTINLYVADPITSFNLPERYAIQTGETVTVTPTNANGNQAYTMSVGTESVAQVDGMTIRGLKPGRTMLTVTSWNGTERTVEVLVYDPIRTVEVDRIESKNGQVSLSAPKTDLFVQMNYRAHSKAVSDQTYSDDLVTWSSSDPGIIRVDDPITGEFRTVSYGAATLTATAANGVSDSLELHVRKEVNNFYLPTSISAYVLSDQRLEMRSVIPEDAYADFVWSVEPAELGTVEGNVLHVLTDTAAEGTLTATSWDGYVTKSVPLHILQEQVTAVTLEPYGDGETGVGGDYPMTAHVTAGTEYVNRFVTWSSSDESIATVSAEGVVHVLGSGEYTITASAADNSDVSDSITLTGVQGVEVFTVSPAEITLYPDDSVQISISDIQPENAVVRDFTYSIEPAGVASVEEGLVTPLTDEDAEAVITVTSWNGTVREIPLTIVRPVIQRFEHEALTELSVGESRQLNSRVWVDDTLFENRFLSYGTMNPSIATVDETGSITGVSNGTTRYYIYDAMTGETLASEQITVRKPLERFDVYCNYGSYNLPASGQFSISYRNINPGDAYVDMSWSADMNGEAYEIASVSGSTARVDIPDREGTLTVTATNVNGVSASWSINLYYSNMNELTTDTDNNTPRTQHVPIGDSAALPVYGWRNGNHTYGQQVPKEKLSLSYVSDNEDVVTVDENGNVTGITKGNANVTVTHLQSNHSVTIPVHVAEPVESFDLPSRILLPCETEKELPVQNMNPATAWVGDLIWTIEPASAAKVEDGKVIALADSDVEATITATSVNGVSRSAKLVVYTPWVEHIEFEPMPYAPSFQDVQVKAHVWADGVEYVNKFVTFECYSNWDLTDPHNIDSKNGILYAYDTDTKYITATAASGVQAVMEVHFKPSYEDFQPATLLMKVNSGDYIRISSYEESESDSWDFWDCNPDRTDRLFYDCQSTGITVNSDGYVRSGSERGIFPVTISSVNGVTRQANVIVYEEEDIEGVSIVPIKENHPIYETIPLSATVSMFGEEVPENRFVTWESSAPNVASVVSNGSLRTLGYGTATITATDVNGHTDSVTITVRETPDNFTLPALVTAVYGRPVTLSAESVTPADAPLEITWSVEPEGLVSISGNVLTALVNEDVTATLTAVNWDGAVRSTTLQISMDPWNLPGLTLPELLTEIEEEAFTGIAAQRVTVPVGCTAIGSRAFADSDQLRLVEILSGTGNIADDAFDGCENLTIVAPEGSDAQQYAEEHGIPFTAIS